MLALFTIKYIKVIRVKQITAVLNIIYKLGGTTNIVINPSLIKSIKMVINVFTFMFNC